MASCVTVSEDRLIANASKDPAKLDVFLKGVGGHCQNAFYYFSDEMPDIKEKLEKLEVDTKFYEVKLENEEIDYFSESLLPANYKNKKEIDRETYRINVINSIKKKYPEIRQKGKSYTFGMSYGASEHLVGKEIYEAYWTLYKVTKEYQDGIIKQAEKQGYLISRYSGLRLLIPDIKSWSSQIKEKAQRVATNFNIQSGNILTLYAIVCFQKKIEEAGLINEVKIVNTIHDSILLYIKLNPKIIKFVNDNLIKCMIGNYNNSLYEEPIVKLEAELDLGYNYKENITLSNNINEKEIEKYLKELDKL